jgi:MFS family permease
MLLAVAASSAAYAVAVVSPLQETMRVALALSDNQMALLQGPALALPMVIAAVPLGLLIDRYSRVRLLLICVALDVAGSVLTAQAATFAVLFAARCLIGLTATVIITTAFSLLSDLYPPAQRGRAMMVMSIGQAAGPSAAFALGGLLITLASAGSNGWQWTMLWLTCPLVLVFLLMLTMREPGRTAVVIENASVRDSFVELWGYRAVVGPLLAGFVLTKIAVTAAVVWAAPAFSRSFALAPDRIGAIIGTALLISGIVGPLLGGLLADFCQRAGGPQRTMLMLSGLTLLSVFAGLFPIMSGVGWASVLLVALLSIINAILIAGIALFTVVIPNELRGLSMGALAGAEMLFGVGLAPIMVSLLAGAIGGSAAIGNALSLVCVASCLLGAGVFAFGKRYLTREVAL